jgi:hypothetical protein
VTSRGILMVRMTGAAHTLHEALCDEARHPEHAW